MSNELCVVALPSQHNLTSALKLNDFFEQHAVRCKIARHVAFEAYPLMFADNTKKHHAAPNAA